MSTPTTSTGSAPANRHVLTAVERQRMQLERLLKDPMKPAYVPPPAKEKTIRPPREMMKNVQGSSAGAGSGEFHVYKASRRREYERLKLLEEATQKELIDAEFERKKHEAEELSNSKTAKNRAKRLKKKERAKTKGSNGEEASHSRMMEEDGSVAEAPLKKRRLVNGKELVFRQPGEGDDGEDDEEPLEPQFSRTETQTTNSVRPDAMPTPEVVDLLKITIHEDD